MLEASCRGCLVCCVVTHENVHGYGRQKTCQRPNYPGNSKAAWSVNEVRPSSWRLIRRAYRCAKEGAPLSDYPKRTRREGP